MGLDDIKTELQLKGASKLTIKCYVLHNLRFLEFINKSEIDITEADLKKYLAYLLAERELSASSVGLVRSALLFNYNKILKKGFMGISTPKIEKKLPIYLSQDEVRKMLELAPTLKSRIILEMLYSSGLRVSELLSLKINDLNLGDRTGKTKGKGNKERIFILSEKVIKHLGRYIKDYKITNFLFPGQKHQQMQSRNVQKIISDLAQKAGIKAGDSIIKIEDTQISSIDQLQKIVRSSEGKELAIILENPVNNQTKTIVAAPVYNKELKAPALGINLGELAVLRYETFGQKLFAGFVHSYNILDYSIRVFGQLIGFAIKERNITPVSEGVSGPVGIAQITSQAVSLGPVSVLQLAGLLSLNLAFINILPIPALDGGRFFFIIVEALIRRRLNPAIEKWTHAVGFAFLLGLILLVTYNDILKLLR